VGDQLGVITGLSAKQKALRGAQHRGYFASQLFGELHFRCVVPRCYSLMLRIDCDFLVSTGIRIYINIEFNILNANLMVPAGFQFIFQYSR
jgi:hypothetical protein